MHGCGAVVARACAAAPLVALAVVRAPRAAALVLSGFAVTDVASAVSCYVESAVAAAVELVAAAADVVLVAAGKTLLLAVRGAQYSRAQRAGRLEVILAPLGPEPKYRKKDFFQ